MTDILNVVFFLKTLNNIILYYAEKNIDLRFIYF